MDIGEWYVVRCHEDGVEREVSPPGREGWRDAFQWADIIRVCFVAAEDFTEQDTIYVFVWQQEESFAIPTGARGADQLWGELIKRDLFDAQLAIEAAKSDGGLYCWPPAS